MSRSGEGRAATKPLTIVSNGETLTEVGQLVFFSDFAAPFSTYIRGGMGARWFGLGDNITFEHDTGRVLVSVLRDRDADTQSAHVQNGMIELHPVPAAWAHSAFTYDAGRGPSSFYIVEANGQVMTIDVQSFSYDGFAATESVVLDEWRWADGSPLR